MRILLVEDEEGIASFIEKSLKSQGYSIDITSSGQKGIFLGRTNDYDVILLDLQLLDMEGFNVCKEIREVKKKVPIMMLTVKSELKDKVKAFELGADDYLVKPFALDELKVRIHALLRRPHIIQEDIITAHNLVVDIKKRMVTKADKEIELRTKEFSLLEYMMRNKGTVLSRSMMLEHVWDMNIDPFTNTVDVHIRSLRKKLDDLSGRIIKTIHGMGYMIE